MPTAASSLTVDQIRAIYGPPTHYIVSPEGNVYAVYPDGHLAAEPTSFAGKWHEVNVFESLEQAVNDSILDQSHGTHHQAYASAHPGYNPWGPLTTSGPVSPPRTPETVPLTPAPAYADVVGGGHRLGSDSGRLGALPAVGLEMSRGSAGVIPAEARDGTTMPVRLPDGRVIEVPRDRTLLFPDI